MFPSFALCLLATIASAAAFAPATLPAMGPACAARVRMQLPFGDTAKEEQAAALDVENMEAPTAPATPSAGAAADIFAAPSELELAEMCTLGKAPNVDAVCD